VQPFPANPEGLPIEVFDGLRTGLVKDRSQFYGANRCAAPYGHEVPRPRG
jgi:non-heme chloroperoxidase